MAVDIDNSRQATGTLQLKGESKVIELSLFNSFLPAHSLVATLTFADRMMCISCADVLTTTNRRLISELFVIRTIPVTWLSHLHPYTPEYELKTFGKKWLYLS